MDELLTAVLYIEASLIDRRLVSSRTAFGWTMDLELGEGHRVSMCV
jgi:hypothetical protein